MEGERTRPGILVCVLCAAVVREGLPLFICVIKHPFCGSSPLTSSSFLPWPSNRVTLVPKPGTRKPARRRHATRQPHPTCSVQRAHTSLSLSLHLLCSACTHISLSLSASALFSVRTHLSLSLSLSLCVCSVQRAHTSLSLSLSLSASALFSVRTHLSLSLCVCSVQRAHTPLSLSLRLLCSACAHTSLSLCVCSVQRAHTPLSLSLRLLCSARAHLFTLAAERRCNFS